MGFFKKKRGKKGFQGMADEFDDDFKLSPTTETTTSSSSDPNSPSRTKSKSAAFGDITNQQNTRHNKKRNTKKPHRSTKHDDFNASDAEADPDLDADASSTHTTEPSIDQLESLVHSLSTCHETYAEAPARALRTLFALSEHHTLHEINRIRMIREANGRLVPTLLQFLQQCDANSSEQYLALLVLNNVSIPSENKRIVAVDCKAAKVLCKMLCWYPESSLISIILVNLCFCDSALRMQLVRSSEDEEGLGEAACPYIIEAFAYTLQVSILPKDEEIPIVVEKDKNPRELLRQLQQALGVPVSASSIFNGNSNSGGNGNDMNADQLPFSSNIAHPETAKWCMCGIKNLSRPSRDPVAAKMLIQSGVLHVVLRVLQVGSGSTRQASNDFHKFSSGEYKGINIDEEIHRNDPYTWDANSMQDAALYILMNLALTPATRPQLRNENLGRRISVISRYSSSPTSPTAGVNGEEQQKDLQCLKARMVSAFLFGSEGHFGQMPVNPPQSISNHSHGHGHGQSQWDHGDELLIKGAEAPLLVELLANTLHGRGKSGPGGYNGTTFNAKKVLFAVRCLLTHPLNIKTFFVTCGIKLNVLLLKALAMHSIEEVPSVDFEAAEDACFSMFLLSNFGFMGPFLPPLESGYPFENIIYCYSRKKTCTAVGKHAATQLLLRHPHLQMNGGLDDDEPRNIQISDLELGDALLHAAESVDVRGSTVGAEPLDDIFGRPVTRKRLPGAAANAGGKMPTPWDAGNTLSSFNSAIEAVQELSFGSKYRDNTGAFIDEIAIANNIAKCANGETDAESYGFEWGWEDGGGSGSGINENDVRKRLNDFRSGRIDSFKGLLKNVRKERTSEPITIFGINCGCNSVIVE